MIKAIHEITVSEGLNPRESVIVAGGGAAGLNIAPIARELGCSTIIVPKTASAMSACGMQFSDIVFEQTRSRVTLSGTFDIDGVNAALNEIDSELERFRKNLHGAARATARKEFFAEARYKSQVWELDTPLPVTRFRSQKDVARLVEAFHAVHDRVYAVRDEASEVECVNWRGTISIQLADTPKTVSGKRGRSKPKQAAARPAYFGSGKERRTPVFRGLDLKPGDFDRGARDHRGADHHDRGLSGDERACEPVRPLHPEVLRSETSRGDSEEEGLCKEGGTTRVPPRSSIPSC